MQRSNETKRNRYCEKSLLRERTVEILPVIKAPTHRWTSRRRGPADEFPRNLGILSAITRFEEVKDADRSEQFAAELKLTSCRETMPGHPPMVPDLRCINSRHVNPKQSSRPGISANSSAKRFTNGRRADVQLCKFVRSLDSTRKTRRNVKKMS